MCGSESARAAAQRSRRRMAVTGLAVFLRLFLQPCWQRRAVLRLSRPWSTTSSSTGSVDPALIADLVVCEPHSLRPGSPRRFWACAAFGIRIIRAISFLSRSMAPALVTANDIVEYDAQGEPVKPNSPNGYLERYIHAAVYRARPDVNSRSAPSHSAAITPIRPHGNAAAACLPHEWVSWVGCARYSTFATRAGQTGIC